MQLNVKVLNPAVPAPTYSRDGDAALDLRAATTEAITLAPGERAEIPSGLAFAIPVGHVGLLFPRGGLGTKGLNMCNTVGVIDSNYRGEVMQNMLNTGLNPITIQPLDRITQLVILPIAVCNVVQTENLDETNRGEARYTSSGTA